MITATLSAIATAARNEAKMTGYNVEEWPSLPGVFYVENPQGQVYVTNTRPGVEHCSCEAFKKSGICKHVCHCEKRIALEQAEAEDAEREAAKYEL